MLDYIRKIGDWPAMNTTAPIQNITALGRPDLEKSEIRDMMRKFRNYGAASLFGLSTKLNYKDPQQSILRVSMIRNQFIIVK